MYLDRSLEKNMPCRRPVGNWMAVQMQVKRVGASYAVEVRFARVGPGAALSSDTIVRPSSPMLSFFGFCSNMSLVTCSPLVELS